MTRHIMHCFCVFILLVSNLFATTYYVDGNASGLNNGSTWANAFETLAQAGALGTTGHIVLIANGYNYEEQDDATDSVLNCDTTASRTAPMVYQGCTGTGDETNFVPAQASIDPGTNNLDYGIIAANNTAFRHLTIVDANVNGIGTFGIDGCFIQTCVISNCGTSGIDLDNATTVVDSIVTGNTNGIQADSDSYMFANKVFDNTTLNIAVNGGNANYNLMYGAGLTAHLRFNSDAVNRAVGNTIDGETSGVGIDWEAGATMTYAPVAINNCIYDLTTGMQTGGTTSQAWGVIMNNLFNSNTTDTDADIGSGIYPSDNKITAAPGFKNEATGDYEINVNTPSDQTDAGLYAGVRGPTGAMLPGDFPFENNVLSTDSVNGETGTASAGGGRPRRIERHGD